VAITVGARKLQDILRALPDTADVSLTLDDKRITLKAGKSRFQLQTLPAADYPRLAPPEGEGVHFTTTQKAFKKQLALVQYAMAQQDIRYYLNGLLLVVAGNLLRMVATDGHRLAYAASPLVGDYARTDVILPRKTVVELARQLADSDDPLEVTLVGNQIVFRFGTIELISKLIDGKFPDYERVIPQGHPKLVKASRLALLQSLQRAAILTNEKFRGVRLMLSEGSLKLVSTNAEQEEALEELEVDYSGDSLDIGFNVTYLARRAHQRLCQRDRNPLQRRQRQRPLRPRRKRRFQVRRHADAHLTAQNKRAHADLAIPVLAVLQYGSLLIAVPRRARYGFFTRLDSLSLKPRGTMSEPQNRERHVRSAATTCTRRQLRRIQHPAARRAGGREEAPGHVHRRHLRRHRPAPHGLRSRRQRHRRSPGRPL
jgi:DNA polymerase-3 subunit beta